MNSRSARILWFAALFTASITGFAQGQETGSAGAPPGAWASVLTPTEKGLVIARKPLIKGVFHRAVDPASVTIVVDGTDYTALSIRTATGFEVTPPLPLPPGAHQVTVSARDASGAPLTLQSVFRSKHFEFLDEAVSRNDLTGTYEVALNKPSSQDNSVNNAREEANLVSSSLVRRGPWKASLDGTARYRDQSLPIPYPEREGADIINYTFRAGYDLQPVKVEAAVGDVVVNETPNTVASLARRGATLEANAGMFSLRGFTVRSDAVYGTRGGLSATGGLDRHIRGGAGAVRLFENKMELRGVYVDGGETPGGYNVATTSGGARNGDVLGFLWTSNFFAGKFQTDVEADFSRFRQGTHDNVTSNRDHAFRARGFGASSIYTYEALFEYVGRDYEVVGNSGLARNREGGKLSGGANFGKQTLSTTLSRYSDNVRGDKAFPVNVLWHGDVTYGLTRWQTLPMSVTLAWDRQRSEDAPAQDNNVLNKDTGTVTAQVSHNAAFVNTSLSGSYSKTDDKSVNNADSDAWNVRLAPAFTFGASSVTPSVAYSEATSANVRTDTVTYGLDGRTQLYRNKVTGEVGSSYVTTKRADNTQDSGTFTGNFRIGYAFDPLFRELFRPSVAVRGTYNHVKDRITPASDRDEWTMFLTVAAQIPVVF
jgi:hypothetical protein